MKSLGSQSSSEGVKETEPVPDRQLYDAMKLSFQELDPGCPSSCVLKKQLNKNSLSADVQKRPETGDISRKLQAKAAPQDFLRRLLGCSLSFFAKLAISIYGDLAGVLDTCLCFLALTVAPIVSLNVSLVL